MRLLFCLLVACLAGCSDDNTNDLSTTKTDFINTIFEGNIAEGPFRMNYSIRTVLFSKEIISLFGHLDVYTHLPHSCGRFEGKTYCKINNKFKEISIDDIFTTSAQKEFLRKYCENNLKHQSVSYFSGDEPLHTHLDVKDIHTFVVDDKSLIIIFSPYCAGNYVDGPHVVKISYEELIGHWDPKNPLASLLPITAFTSSWDVENLYWQLPEESQIGE